MLSFPLLLQGFDTFGEVFQLHSAENDYHLFRY